jgi:hypothetical protein
MMTEAVIARYESFRELTAPFDEHDIGNILEGLLRLVDMVNDDVDSDLKYFKKPFAR